jgi:DNA-binding transcriptional ArsR family regulator
MSRRWTREAILFAIGEWVELHGRPPALVDWTPSLARASGQHWRAERHDDGDWPTSYDVRRAIGRWSEAIRAAGYVPMVSGVQRGSRPGRRPDPRPWTREAVLAALRDWTAEHGEPPREQQWRGLADPRYPPVTIVHRLCGGWSAALRAARLAPRTARPRVTDEQIIAALRSWAERHGAPPAANAWQAARARPAYGTIFQRFGSWSRALEAAGLQSRRPGERGPARTFGETERLGELDAIIADARAERTRIRMRVAAREHSRRKRGLPGPGEPRQPRQPRPATVARWEQIADLYRRDVPIREIAADLGTTPGTVTQHLNRMRERGWELPYRRPALTPDQEAARERRRRGRHPTA